jgi:hypothetical protein
MSIPIKNLGAVGYLKDVLPHQLPPNAWSEGQNVRFVDGYVERMSGHTSVYGTPTVVPNWLLPVPGLTDYYWIYASLAKVYMVDSARTHTEITRAAGGDYGGNLDVNWNGGLLNGIPVLNNGVDDPQFLNPPTPASDLALLTNWPANTKVRVLRPFKQYLFGMDWTESGTRFQHKVRWSNQAAAGAVPSSWDVTSSTVDTGQATLPDSGGFALDSLPLRDVNIVYKENEIWGFQYVGGAQVFRPYRIVSEAGMLTRDCAVTFYNKGLRHAVFGGDDLLIHDGNTAESIADRKLRRWLYSQISTSNFERCFAAPNYPMSEVWFCFVQEGQTHANLALPWNWRTGVFGTPRQLPNIRYATAGLINDGVAGTSWDSDSGSWDSDTSAWDERLYGSASKKLLMGVPTGPTLQFVDQGNQFAGTNFTAYIERVGIPYARVDRNGDPESDVNVKKLMTELWPRFEASPGTVVEIYVGSHEEVNQGVNWAGPFNFIVGTHQKINPMVQGRFLAVKFQSTANAQWKLHEYAMTVVETGRYG